jgi:glycosyltransferase involved in cell wall biosynthesis
MSMQRAVVTTDAVGCRETVREGRNGYMVPVGDAKALAEAMMRFIRQPERIAAMGLESRRYAEERFDVHKVNEAVLREMDLL